MHEKFSGFSTTAIHGGKEKNAFNALATPIYQSSTFVFNSAEEGGRRFAGEEEGYIYTRLGNPNLSVFENKIAALEGGVGAVATASGMGAISAAFWTKLKAGDHVVAASTLYGCSFALISHGLTRFGINVTFVDGTDADSYAKAITPATKVIYIETPANPNLKVLDIAAIAGVARAHKVELWVDNTFPTPYLQQPLKLGADLVIHSVTKYLNGHGDVVAGVLVGNDPDFLKEVRLFGVKDMTGAVLSPHDAWLIERGMKTLPVRMQRHCENAVEVANFLDNHSMVTRVYYPGLKNDPGYEVASKQMRLPGAIVAFELRGGLETGKALMNSVELCTLAVSLGDTETLIQHPASMTHSPYTPEERASFGISETMVRISVGLEDVKDILLDLDSALAAVASKSNSSVSLSR
jgi:methionine-gamma-lyase